MLSPARIDALLDAWPVARLATLAADGWPRLVPCVFARHGGSLWTPIDAKPKNPRARELARVRDVRRDPRVTLLLDQYADDWSTLWWIRVSGDAAVRTPGGADDGRFGAAAAALRAKYRQYDETPLFSGSPTLIEVRPLRVASWSAS